MLLALCLPQATSRSAGPVRSRCSRSSSITAALEGHAAADDERLDDVGVLRGRLRVAAAARAARDDARRGGQRVQPVPPEQQGAQSAAPHAVQRWRRWSSPCRAPGLRVPAARRHRAGDDVRDARAAAGRRRDGVLPAEHRAGRDRDRAVDRARRSSTTWHTNFLWSAPSYFVGAGTAALAASLVTQRRLLGRAARPSRRST